MPAGRPKTPQSLKILKGTYRADRDGTPEQIVRAGGVPEPPGDLPDAARELWDRVVPGLIASNVVRACDAPALEVMCRWWGEWRRAATALDAEGLEDGKRYVLLNTLSMASKQFNAAAARFGLNPSDRAKLRVEPPSAPAMAVPARKR